MSDLRNHLFETLEALKDSEEPMDIDRAKAISEVAQTVINSAKVELEFYKAIESDEIGPFFDNIDRADRPGPKRLGSVDASFKIAR